MARQREPPASTGSPITARCERSGSCEQLSRRWRRPTRASTRRCRPSPRRAGGCGRQRGMSETALDLLAALVLEDGRRWGEAAVPVQWQDSRAVLDTTSSTPLHWLGRARGYSKTTDLAGMAIAAML